jgi:hypothetical protein
VSLPFSGPVHFTKWSSEGGNSRHFIHLIHSIMMFVSPLGPTDNDEFFSSREKINRKPEHSALNVHTVPSLCGAFLRSIHSSILNEFVLFFHIELQMFVQMFAFFLNNEP